jgi:hypothetical protein
MSLKSAVKGPEFGECCVLRIRLRAPAFEARNLHPASRSGFRLL